ncbi:hypothetical protein EDB81DRAFT_890420 [Dactylonectria macrodidyma]|uniref:Uncharacterized protein n=1 Tax=Dactylonectria macrodidyma TaxID=307937 RepID=A0A9P9DSP6_9HYPO|nr:hypothetical protein EDB81DRAFT_890420 [Dactylonectria macrodidyma]
MPGRDDNELQRLTAVDGLFFGGCIDGLSKMPLIARLLLSRPHPNDVHSRPFGLLQQKTSIDRYLVYCKRFLYYCLNVLYLDEGALAKEHSFRFKRGQRAGLEQLWARLQDEEQSGKALEVGIL